MAASSLRTALPLGNCRVRGMHSNSSRCDEHFLHRSPIQSILIDRLATEGARESKGGSIRGR